MTKKKLIISVVVFSFFVLVHLFQDKLEVFAVKVPATPPATSPNPVKTRIPTPTRVPVTPPVK